MLAGLIGAAAGGLKGAADAYSVGAKSEFDSQQKLDLSKQLLDMEEQKALRVDAITRTRNVEDVGRLAAAGAAAAPVISAGVVAGQVAAEDAIKSTNLLDKKALNEVAGVNAKTKAGLPEAEAALAAKRLVVNKANVTEDANQKGAAKGTEFNAEVNTPNYLKNKQKVTEANESSGTKAQGALATFTLTNAKVLADARLKLSKETDPDERDRLTRSISDLSGASTKNFGDVATAARSWVEMAKSLRKDAEMASPEDAIELTTRAQDYEKSADALLKSIADKRLPGSTIYPIPVEAAINDIKTDPGLIPAFNKKYGPGAAAKYLKAK
jgi:hypothetical protein